MVAAAITLKDPVMIAVRLNTASTKTTAGIIRFAKTAPSLFCQASIGAAAITTTINPIMGENVAL